MTSKRWLVDESGLRGGRALALRARRQRLPRRCGQLDLSEPDRLRRALDRLVVADDLEPVVERQRPRRDQPYGLVGGCGSRVRQLLWLRRGYLEIGVARGLRTDPFFVTLR